jgi:hypothetical protein
MSILFFLSQAPLASVDSLSIQFVRKKQSKRPPQKLASTQDLFPGSDGNSLGIEHNCRDSDPSAWLSAPIVHALSARAAREQFPESVGNRVWVRADRVCM